jgi:hypothetical protein
MNGRSGILRGFGVPSPIPEAAAPPATAWAARIWSSAPAKHESRFSRTIMGRLPLREFLEFEGIWPVRQLENFLEDCRTHFGAREVNA